MTFCNLSWWREGKAQKSRGIVGWVRDSPVQSSTGGHNGTVAKLKAGLVPATAKAKHPGRIRTWPWLMATGKQPRLGHAHKGR